MLLAGAHERQADALTAMLDANGQSIHVAPPAVPGGDQCTKDRAVAVGDEQAPRCLSKQSLRVPEPVGSRSVLATSLLPKLENGRCLPWAARSHNEISVSQGVTVSD